MTERRRQLIALFADEFDRRHWRDPGDVALRLATAIDNGETAQSASNKVGSRFLAVNDLTRAEVGLVVAGVAKRVGPPSARGSAAVGQVSEPSTPAGTQPQKRQASVARVVVGLAVAATGVTVVAVLPEAIQWSWLLTHPNALALRALGAVVVVLAATWIIVPRQGIAALAGAALVALLALLGR